MPRDMYGEYEREKKNDRRREVITVQAGKDEDSAGNSGAIGTVHCVLLDGPSGRDSDTVILVATGMDCQSRVRSFHRAQNY
jgi:hypothetical protein